AKIFLDAMSMASQKFNGLETRIVRIFNTYWKRMRLNYGRGLPSFIAQALMGEEVTVIGDGTHTRSVCYVSDQVEGIFRLLLSDYTLPMNIGNPDELTIRQIAEEIITLTGNKSGIRYESLPVDDPKQRRPDISKARQILGWQPTVSREEGLERTISYFKQLSSDTLKKGDFTYYNQQ